MEYRPAARTLLLVSLLLSVSAIAGSAPTSEQRAEPEAGAGASRDITDMRGRNVTLPGDIDRIIAVGANSLRLLAYFDSIEKVIAVEDTGHSREKSIHDFFYLATYRIAHPGLQTLPSIGSAENHEAIIAAGPDVVFSSTIDIGQLDQLQATLGIPVFGIDADVELNDLDRFLHQFHLVGRVLGEEQRGAELVDGIRGLLGDLSARKKLVGPERSSYVGGMMYYGPADLLRTTGDYVPFDLTGTRNVMPTNPAGNCQPYMTTVEALIAADPDYVFIDAANIGLSRSSYIANRAVLDGSVNAFANRNVYTTLVYKYYGTNWENQIINIFYVGSIVYPELYRDIVIERKSEEIWRLFFQVDLDYPRVIALHDPGYGRADWW